MCWHAFLTRLCFVINKKPTMFVDMTVVASEKSEEKSEGEYEGARRRRRRGGMKGKRGKRERGRD